MRKFTLIELLIVIALIALLLTLLLPSLSKAREEAYKAVCMSNQKELYKASVSYAMGNEGWVPPPILHIIDDPDSGQRVKVQSMPFWIVLPSYLDEDEDENDLSEIFFCSKHESIPREHLNWPKNFPSIGGAFTWTTNVNGKKVNGQYNLKGYSNHWNQNQTRANPDVSTWLMYGDSPNHQSIGYLKGGSVVPPANYRHNGEWVQISFAGHINTMRSQSLYNAIYSNGDNRGDWGGYSLLFIPE